MKGIDYVTGTWNPVVGCPGRVSPGCDRCWAEAMARRVAGAQRAGAPIAGYDSAWRSNARLVPRHLADPLRWRKPRRVAVGFMGDFATAREADIALVYGVMAAASAHRYLLLTKRPGVLWDFYDAAGEVALSLPVELALQDRAYYEGQLGDQMPSPFKHCGWPLPHVAVGVSVEDQKRADVRIPELLRIPAAIRWVSVEPLLGPVDLDMGGLDWIVIGGETGPRARGVRPEWVLDLVEQARHAGVACWVKDGPAERALRANGYRAPKQLPAALRLPGEQP